MSLRRILAAGLLTSVLAVGGARGQQIVHDPLNFVQLVAQLKQLHDEFIVLQESYQELQMTYASLHHLSPQSMEVAAGLLSNAQHLPGSAAAAIPGLAYGTNLSGAGAEAYARNHYYTPEGHDWNALEMQRQQYATANLQGEAQTSLTMIAERLTGLNQLQASIPEQPDVTAVTAINARISSEQAFLTNERSHLANLQALQASQQSVDIQRAEQHSREMYDQRAAALAAQAWGQ